MKAFKTIVWISLLLMPFFFIACGGGGSGSSDTGTLSLGLTDAATDNYQAVYVTISEIKVHRSESADDEEGGWITVATPGKTLNLLELMNGVIEPLGATGLEAGIYSQMRLYLGEKPDITTNILSQGHPFANYVILDDVDNTVEELTVPSGYQTGVKLVREFEIVAGLTVDLVVDFDASASVVEAGNSGKYQLKPTIKITDTVDNAILSGTVTDDSSESAYLDGALVSAQYSDPIIFTATQTVGGEYLMYLPPNTYNVVVYKSGFMPECKNITTALNDLLTENFELTAVTPITVTVNVSGLPTDEQSATISFRQEKECAPAVDEQVIEVDKLNVGNGEGYKINLPEGEYTVVSSSEGMITSSEVVNVVAGMGPLTVTFETEPVTP